MKIKTKEIKSVKDIDILINDFLYYIQSIGNKFIDIKYTSDANFSKALIIYEVK
jgi:hypothetical protein